MTEAQIPQVVYSICLRHLKSGGFSLYLFGSRASNKNTPTSDFDFYVVGQELNSEAVERVRSEIDKMDTLFKIDFYVWYEIPDDLKSLIKKSSVVKVEG